MSETTVEPGSYGLHDTMRKGFNHALSNVTVNHPVEYSEKMYFVNAEKKELSAVRTAHGLHMPVKLRMEKAVAAKIHRLPGLPSSNLALRTLMGINDMIGPEDIFNDTPEQMDYLDLKL
ncbi:proteasome maturation protein-like [Hydractinia symbiolongicarpus]|uniref:proteasome maturation protein-like n=1 Tax=Hydractinia symbiolongicarpus TaxID=13093 RepID=UPI00254CF024|nr:proteasome maturation protein-like [Hydractinia symbiolongicarpus]